MSKPPRTFLGKHIPNTTHAPKHPHTKPPTRGLWAMLFVVPVVLGATLITQSPSWASNNTAALQRNSSDIAQFIVNGAPATAAATSSLQTSPSTTTTDSPSQVSDLTTVSNNARILLATSPIPSTPGINTQKCENSTVYDALKSAPLFPIIPDVISGGGTPASTCIQAYWGRGILFFIILRTLQLIGWAAGAAAILLTATAGLFYIAGFGSKGEDNVKKAKKILTATYAGLAIVLLSQFIVRASFNIFVNQSDRTIDNALGGGADFENTLNTSP
jgi:hypothetical protein